MRYFIFIFMSFLLSSCSNVDDRKARRPQIAVDAVIHAPLEQVWADWTTAEGLDSFLGPKAIVDLRPGGAYEVWFLPDAEPGQRGAEDGVILGIQDKVMINFTWAMPPYMPEIRPHMTSVQIFFLPIEDNQTKVKLFHTGFGEGAAWEKGREYFETVWPDVLAKEQAKYSDTDDR